MSELETCYVLNRSELRAVASRFTRGADVEDILHDAFLSALSTGSPLRPGENALPWMRTIVVRKAIDHLRKQRRGSAACDLAEHRTPVQESAESEAMVNVFFEGVERCVTGSPILRRRLLDDAAYGDIARAEQVPLGTVKTKIARGLRKLRPELARDLALRP